MTTENQDGQGQPEVKPITAPEAKPAQAAGTPTPEPEKKPDEAATGVIEYQPIEGDPGLTMALQFVGKHGIGPDSPAMQAALKGDFSFLKAELASKGAAAVGFEHYIAMAEKSWENHVASSAEKHSKTATAIHAAVGGEEQWKAIQKWAGENADPEEKTAINAMLDAGGLQARAAAMLLQQMHATASGTVVEPAAATAGVQPSGGGAAATTALSPAEYAKEVAALTAKLGTYGAGKSKEMEVLRTRRQQYRG